MSKLGSFIKTNIERERERERDKDIYIYIYKREREREQICTAGALHALG